MAWKWKTAPVYPGVTLDLGDRYYTPGTRDSGIVYSRNLIPDEDINRINKQTGSSANTSYLLRPSSQSGWRPNVTKPQVTKNSKAPTTSTGKPRTSTPSATGKPRTAPKAPTTDNYTQSVSKIIGDGKIQQNMLNNAVQNQTSQYRLTKPNLGYNPSQNNQLVNLKFEKGGQMYKYAAGAQMVQPQQANSQDPIDQIAQIAVGSLQGDKASKQKLIEVLSNEQIAPKLLQMVDKGVKNQDKRAMIIAQAIKALQGGSRKARLGAKLDYIKQSIGECPEGQEVVYFKKGGEICKMCAGKKMQDGGKSDPIKNFKKKKKMK